MQILSSMAIANMNLVLRSLGMVSSHMWIYKGRGGARGGIKDAE